MYGIIDNFSSPINSRNELLKQEILDEWSLNNDNNNYYRLISNNYLGNLRGWYIDLTYNNQKLGERILTTPIIRDGKIIITTMLPSLNACSIENKNWLMELNWLSGSRLDYTVFDINNDGIIDKNDYIQDPSSSKLLPVSGKQLVLGTTTSPIILENKDNEIKYFNDESGKIKSLPLNKNRQLKSWKQLK
jgi:type IV pilus assembly protein PilY1